MINKNDVEHIASLARIKIDENEINKYQSQLTDILTEIDKIISVEIPETDIMISPSINKNRMSEDIIGSHISRETMFKNAKNVKGDYIYVTKVIE